MLSATELHVKGRHRDLLPATTLQAATGTLLLVQADGQDTRTALALALTGRMRPSSGAACWGQDPNTAHLRRHSALLDAPGVNEPERHLSVRSLVAEDLALIPGKFHHRMHPSVWLAKHGYSDLAGRWIEELAPDRRLALLADLALSDPDVDVLVVDSPDRHSHDPQDWLTLLQHLVDGGGRRLAVVATVGSVPAGWNGAVEFVGAQPAESEPATAAVAGPSTEPLQRTAESQANR